MPGSTPATSQLDWLISTTAMIVLSWSKATRDLLKSLGWGIRALHQLGTATMVPSPRRLPHTISPLEGEGFEPSVPREGNYATRLPPDQGRPPTAQQFTPQELLFFGIFAILTENLNTRIGKSPPLSHAMPAAIASSVTRGSL